MPGPRRTELLPPTIIQSSGEVWKGHRLMDSVVLQSVSKVFRHRPALFNWVGKERTGETRALDDISLAVAKGKILVLLGPNGSGKTTVLKLISTMLLPDAGEIQVEGAGT